MRTIIAGSRTFWDYNILEGVIADSGFAITQVVCGMAMGADTVGWAWAHVNRIPILELPAKWHQHGRNAGPIRNAEMAKNADALIAVWDGVSHGTKHMIDIAVRKNLNHYVVHLRFGTPILYAHHLQPASR